MAIATVGSLSGRAGARAARLASDQRCSTAYFSSGRKARLDCHDPKFLGLMTLSLDRVLVKGIMGQVLESGVLGKTGELALSVETTTLDTGSAGATVATDWLPDCAAEAELGALGEIWLGVKEDVAVSLFVGSWVSTCSWVSCVCWISNVSRVSCVSWPS